MDYPVEIEGKRLQLSNLDKILFPAAGVAKANVIDYYQRVAPVLLPHLKDRPLTLKRYPDGIDGAYFYEKECPAARPPWVVTASVKRKMRLGKINYCVINDLPSLLWVANLANIEMHVTLALRFDIKRPTMVVFDLDPGPPAGIVDAGRVALMLRNLFHVLHLESFVKTSGGKGMQVYVPLNTPVRYDETKPFAQRVAELLARRFPDDVVSQMKKTYRAGKVFIDWSQNTEHKTMVCVYSLRAHDRPSVATPLKWDEIEAIVEGGDAKRAMFSPEQVLDRIERHGDLFAPVLTLEQHLPAHFV